MTPDLHQPCFSFAYGVLRRFLPEEKVESVKGMALTADGKGAVFDVAAEDLDMFLAGIFLSTSQCDYHGCTKLARVYKCTMNSPNSIISF